MSRFLSGFLTGPSEEEGITDGAVTRARAAAAAVVAAQQAGLEVPQPQVRGYGRSRSPSPRPNGQTFTFPEMADHAEAIKAAAIAAAEAAIRAMGNQGGRPRKPELPEFDKKNVDIWIKRVEAAYTRVGITETKDKFAHLESKFKVDFDPQINDFLFGEATPARWQEFIHYLRAAYGRTRRQEAATILDGVKRDGRRPTQLRSYIYDKIGTISIDEIVREMMMRELPIDVQRSLQERSDKMSSKELADAADAFFDQDGRPIHSSTSAVNAIEDGAIGGEIEDDADVNAVNFRHKQRGRFNRNPPQKPFTPKQNGFTKPFSHNEAPKQAGSFQAPKTVGKPLCMKHRKFKDKAYSCEPGCARWEEFNAAGSGNAGNATAGRRM